MVVNQHLADKHIDFIDNRDALDFVSDIIFGNGPKIDFFKVIFYCLFMVTNMFITNWNMFVTITWGPSPPHVAEYYHPSAGARKKGGSNLNFKSHIFLLKSILYCLDIRMTDTQ